jgi:excisionase family DNA binding protein
MNTNDSATKRQRRVTLKEMARLLNRCEKTFRKYVVEYQIPHICLGRDMLFNVEEVESYLKNMTMMNENSTSAAAATTKSKSKSKRNKTNLDKSKNKYANLLGLS